MNLLPKSDWSAAKFADVNMYSPSSYRQYEPLPVKRTMKSYKGSSDEIGKS